MRISNVIEKPYFRRVLLFCKAYSLCGILGFLIWDRLRDSSVPGARSVYGGVLGVVIYGYLLSGLVLLICGVSGLLRTRAFGHNDGSSSLAFAFIDLCILLLLGSLLPG